MINKLFNFFLKYNFKLPWFLFSYLKVNIFIFKNKFNIIYRTNLEYKWTKTFVNYYRKKEVIDELTKWLWENEAIYIKTYLEKIKYVNENNLLEYKKCFNNENERIRKDFLYSYFEYKNDDIFKNIECYNNLYFIPKCLDNLWLKTDENTDILDCGWYIWDSGIVFSNYYEKSKVHVFEPDCKNFQSLKENIIKYNKVWKIFAINNAVWKQTWKWYIDWNWAWANINNINWKEINIISIDEYVNSNWLNPTIIKWDIEWFEYESVLWAIETIKKFRPTLFISIYHTGKDFFEIKPLIESLWLWYKFQFDRWNANTIFSDIVLICYR